MTQLTTVTRITPRIFNLDILLEFKEDWQVRFRDQGVPRISWSTGELILTQRDVER